MDFDVNVKKIWLQKLRLAVRCKMSLQYLSHVDFDVDLLINHAAGEMVATLGASLASKADKTTERKSFVTYPDGLWNYIKHRWFPAFLLRKYPVKYAKFEYVHTTEVVRMCPHVAMPKHEMCIQFLVGEERRA